MPFPLDFLSSHYSPGCFGLKTKTMISGDYHYGSLMIGPGSGLCEAQGTLGSGGPSYQRGLGFYNLGIRGSPCVWSMTSKNLRTIAMWILCFIKLYHIGVRESWSFRIPDTWKFLILEFGNMMAQYDETESQNFKGYQSLFTRPPLPHPWERNILNTGSTFFCQLLGLSFVLPASPT